MKKVVLALVLNVLLLSQVGLFAEGQGENAGKAVVTYTRWAGSQEAIDFQALVDKYNASQNKVFVKTDFLPWAAYWEKVRTSMLSGDAADIISMSSAMAGQYLTKGGLLDMDTLPGARTLFADIQPGARSSVEVSGKIKAFPIGLGVRAVIYNKDMLTAAGVPFPDSSKPWTWDQWKTFAQ